MIEKSISSKRTVWQFSESAHNEHVRSQNIVLRRIGATRRRSRTIAQTKGVFRGGRHWATLPFQADEMPNRSWVYYVMRVCVCVHVLCFYIAFTYIWLYAEGHKNTTILQRVHIAGNAERCNSQRDSVRLSVCPSRSGIVSRRMKIRSCGFQRLVGQWFCFLER